MVLFGLSLLLALTPVRSVRAQVQVWHVGRDGLSWGSQMENQVGVADVEGALLPLEVESGVNLVQLLVDSGQKWVNGTPDDYTQGGLPHTWANAPDFMGIKGPLRLIDGDPETSTQGIFKTARDQAGADFFWDLGAIFPINRVRFFPEPDDSDSYMKAFEIFAGNGRDFDQYRRPVYRSLRRVEVNSNTVVDISFATVKGRFIRLRHLAKTAFNLAEVEIYGQGFVPSSSYLSELHLFDNPVNFGRLLVEATNLGGGAAEVDPVTLVQVRSGADDTPLNYFRRDRETGSQEEVSGAEYENQLPRLAFFRVDPVTREVTGEVGRSDYLTLPVQEQGPVRDFDKGAVRIDAENWSAWSAQMRIDSTGSFVFPLDLPSPRSYLQFRIFFEGDAENTMRIDDLRIEFSPRLTSKAEGEVALASDLTPEEGVATVPGGVDTAFVYDIRAEFDEDGLEGFQGVELAAFPSPVFERLEMGSPLASVDEFEVEPTEHGFKVFFADVGESNNQPIRIVFRQEILEYNTPINAWLLGTRGGLSQPVSAGDANQAVNTNKNYVFATSAEPTLQTTFSTVVLTPNGDGANDAAEIDYVLAQFADDVEIDIAIFDLAGRRVRELVAVKRSAGAYQVDWDGRDDGGGLVPPGNYICLIEVESQAKTFAETKLLGVVY